MLGRGCKNQSEVTPDGLFYLLGVLLEMSWTMEMRG